MKIVLDTNVYSQLIHPQGTERVRRWVDALPELAAIYADERNANGDFVRGSASSRGSLSGCFAGECVGGFSVGFGGSDFAVRFGGGGVVRTDCGGAAAGGASTQFDGQIAAICRVSGAVLATRNVKDFEECGVEVVNPWAG